MSDSRRVLLIGWAGAEWNLIRPLLDTGAMPNLTRLIETGVSGDLASLQPTVGPMLWTSVDTGKRPHKHGVHGVVEPRGYPGQIQPVGSRTRTAKAVWNMLAERGLRAHVVNAAASHPAEHLDGGVVISDRFAAAPAGPGVPWPMPEDCVFPAEIRDALAPLRLRPEDLDVGVLRSFVPTLDPSHLDGRDPRLTSILLALAHTATVHAAATWALEHHPWDFAAVQYDGLHALSRAFLPYHPPRMAVVPPPDFERYRGVVSAAYGFFDLMLGRLLDLSKSDTTVLVVSEHGYTTGAQCPPNIGAPSVKQASGWHHPRGVFVMAGPGVRRDDLIEGASLLDVAPTVLTLFDLPVGDDMDGRPLLTAFDDPPPVVRRTPTWDGPPAPHGEPPPASGNAPADVSLEAIRHLLDLGYAEPPPAELERAVARVRDANRFNLALSLIDAGRSADAITILEALARRRPDQAAYQKALFDALALDGRIADARQLLDRIWAQGYRGPLVRLGLAVVLIGERRANEALAHLRAVERMTGDVPALHELAGHAYLRLRQWASAERALTRAAELAGGSAQTWDHLAVAALGAGDAERAAERALRAVGLRGDFPQAHYHLGLALRRLGRANEALVAIERCLALAPAHLAAHRQRVELFEGPLRDPARAQDARWQQAQVSLRRRPPAGVRSGRAPAPSSGAGSAPASG